MLFNIDKTLLVCNIINEHDTMGGLHWLELFETCTLKYDDMAPRNRSSPAYVVTTFRINTYCIPQLYHARFIVDVNVFHHKL
jgi:hypothetical protein